MATPKLRFKEFDGDWYQSDFAKASIKIIDGDRGANYPKSDDFYDEEFCLFLNAGNVTKQGFSFENTQFIAKEKDQLLRKGKLARNDLVITTRGTVGNVAYFDKSIPFENMRINSGMVIARCQNNVIADFINQFLKSDLFDKWLDKNAFGSAQPQLTVKLLNSIQLNYPSKEEQTKIASFLSTVDEKISQLIQKHELLSQYKQGMMQKLFSQQIRFKADDGSEFGEWRETTVGAITKSISAGATPSTLKEEYWGGDIKWMSSGELNYKHVYDVEKTITELGFKSSSTKLIPKYSVLIGLAGQGKTRGTVAINYIELCTNQSIAAIHPNPKVFDHRFIFFNLDMRYQELRALSTGDGGRGGLNLQIIKGVELELPCLEEQTKIANFLSAIDQKIEVVAQQIEQAKQWKKGLLQQLFV